MKPEFRKIMVVSTVHVNVATAMVLTELSELMNDTTQYSRRQEIEFLLKEYECSPFVDSFILELMESCWRKSIPWINGWCFAVPTKKGLNKLRKSYEGFSCVTKSGESHVQFDDILQMLERAIAEKADYLHYDADGPKIAEAARYDW